MRKDIWKSIGIALVVSIAIASVALVHVEAHPTGIAVQSQSEEGSVAMDARHIGGLPTNTNHSKVGTWAIAEADELPRKFLEIGVTGYQARHAIPQLVKAPRGDETFVTIDRPGADFTMLWGINEQREIVGTAGKGIAFHGGSGFMRRTDGSFVTIDAAIPGVTIKMTSARALNNMGEIVGFYKDASNFNHGFLRGRDGSFTVIDFPGAIFKPFEDESGVFAETGALAIDPQGEIIGNYLSMDVETIKTHGFLLRDGKYTSIDYPGAVLTFIRGINPDGDIVGRYDILDVSTNKVKTHSFLLHHDKFTSIDFPDAVRTFARGINSDGVIVGRYDILDVATNQVKVLGFVFRHGNFMSIDFPANGINSAGEIVGTYTSADGKVHGYLMSGTTFCNSAEDSKSRRDTRGCESGALH